MSHSRRRAEVAVTTSEHRIATARGTLFARTWLPAGPRDGAEATILLFHDSLGCVELWRDFPARLSTATRRAVVAYDRLGFGRSEPHPGSLSPDFFRD